MQRSSNYVRGVIAMSILIVTAASADVAPPHKSRMPAGGTYTDSAGAKHAWSINDADALVWDSKPYVPVGGCFYPACLSSDRPEAWDKDTASLNELKSRGVLDLIIVPDVSLPETSPVRMQKLVEFLDANGFKYGIAFGRGIPDPLTGTVVKPASYKGYPDVSLTASWQTPNADSALIVLAETTTGHNEVAKYTSEKIVDNNLTVPVEAPATVGKVVPYIYPHKSVPSGTRGSIPDIWSGYDTYRDHLLAYFSKVKLGKGFRFFLDPLGAQLSLADETDYLVPDNRAFLLEWESYIRTTYPNIEEAYRAWGLEEASSMTADELARIYPLWANELSIPDMYDPVKHKTIRLADVIECRWWYDFLACRNKSIQYYMNGMANVLKRQIADVPVVYTWTMNHPMFINSQKSGGFDGLGVAANIRGARLINRMAVPAYSEVEQSARKMWCIETSAAPELDPDPSVAETSSPGIPFASHDMVAQEITDLKRAGLKGFFPGSFRDDAANTGRNDWLRTPNALDWLRSSGDSVTSETRAADFSPAVLPYPMSTPGPAIIGPIGSTGVTWMPTYDTGKLFDWWPSFYGYSLNLTSDQNPQTVMVSLRGKREVHFFVTPSDSGARPTEGKGSGSKLSQAKSFVSKLAPARVSAASLISAKTINGAAIPIKIVNPYLFSMEFPDNTPVIFDTAGQELTPLEAVEDVLTQMDGLYRYASAIKSEGIEGAKVAVNEAHLEFSKRNYTVAYTAARDGIGRLLQDTAPYIWIEGENYELSTFDDSPTLPGASQGRYLRVSNYNNPPREYAVHYPFNILAKGKYNIWMAATPPAADVSPVQWALTDNQRREPADPKPHGALYANDKFGWILLGTAKFDQPGPNVLGIYVTGRAAATNRYAYGIDAIFITTGSEPPNGKIMPEPIDPNTIPKTINNKRANTKDR